jgi:FkbM family methyltransferase
VAFAEIDTERLRHFRERGFAPHLIFDIGASDGAWSASVAEVFPDSRYHLFEPLADEEASYRELLTQRLHSHPRWTLHRVALGSTEGFVDFRQATHACGSTSLPVDSCDGLFRTLRLPQTTLDTVIDTCGEVPALVKMDIQGGELDALEGLQRHLDKVELLLLETWLSRSYGGINPLLLDVMNHLAPRGFFPIDLADAYRDERGNLISQDVFFVNRASPLAKDYSF